MLGHDLTETYFNDRLKLAGNRHMIGQLMGVDTSEMFSPERVTAVASNTDWSRAKRWILKTGSAFDLAVDRKKAWDSILCNKPELVIG